MSDDLRAYVESDPEGGYRWWAEQQTPAGWIQQAGGWERERDEAREAARHALGAMRDPQREEIR